MKEQVIGSSILVPLASRDCLTHEHNSLFLTKEKNVFVKSDVDLNLIYFEVVKCFLSIMGLI